MRKSLPNNEVIGRIAIAVNLDLVEVNMVVMVDTAVVMSVVEVADRDCRERTLHMSALDSVNRLSTMLYGLLIKCSSTWPMSEGKESTATVDNVDIVDLDVGELIHVELIVNVIRHADQEISRILWQCREKRLVLLVRWPGG